MKAKRRIAAAISILVATAGLVLVSAPAALADYSTAPRATWSATSGRVYAIERVGNAIVIGGTFTTLRAPTGNQTVTRNRLAAFDAVTGDLLPWNPGANGDVRDLQANADGTGVFVGGAFTNIAGVAKNRLALLRLDTGANVASFTTNVNNQAVLSLARSGDVLFLGGTFTQVNGAARQRLAAVSATTGANVAGWTGSANARVNSIVLSPDGTRLYAGGQFTTLSGETRNFVGAVATTNGAAVAWTPPIPCTDTQNPCYVHDLDADALRVYGAVGGPGGRVSAWDTSTAQRRWAAYTDGDVQAIAVDGTQVYAGGHYAPNFGQQPRTGIVALNSATGGVLPFNPTLVIGELGVWEINPGPDYLRIGGGFTSVNGVGARARYAEFPALNPVDDTTPPTAPTGLGTVLVTDDLVTIDWNASTDDNAVTGYRVLRDGNVVAQTGVTTHTDRDLSPNTTYTYRVQATDAAGNWSNQSSALNVTTAAPSNALVRIGSTWRYLSNGSDQGTAWRGVGFNDSSWSAGPAQLGFGDSDESTVISPLGLTHYFRRTFTANPGSMSGLELRLLRDDGAIVYLNGVEVMRSNMPSGTVNYRTQASSDVNGAAENTFYPQSVPVSRLVNGTNTIAVEIHNRSGSPDVSFDLELRPTGSAPPADTEAPTTPGNLRSTAVTSNSVSLAWNASSDNVAVTGYRVYRGATLATTVTGTAWTDTGRSPNTSYSYTVRAIDAAGNASDASNQVDVTTTGSSTGQLVATGDVWRYRAETSNAPSGWADVSFDDSAWPSGPSQLGFGDGDEATVIPNRRMTYYFRRAITVDNPGSISTLSFQLLRDDGAVVYVNGTEVRRSNLPAGAIDYSTPASSNVSGNAETRFETFTVPASLLVAGVNVIAVEVHQDQVNSSDLSMDLRVTAS